MREGSRARRQKVFDTAYNAGIRHFDVAPLYGLGMAEDELGRLLPRTLGDVTVASKFGLHASAGARIAARVQGPLRQLIARSDRLRSMARSHSRAAVPVVAPRLIDVRESLRRSLSALGLERIDILLLHDIAWSPAVQDLWAELIGPGALPEVGALGVTGDDTILGEYPESFVSQVDVLQVPNGSKVKYTSEGSGGLLVKYGLLSTSLMDFSRWLDEHEMARRNLEEVVGQELRQIEGQASLLAALSLCQDDSSILLIGSTQPAHIESICTGVSSIYPALRENSEVVEDILGTEWETVVKHEHG